MSTQVDSILRDPCAGFKLLTARMACSEQRKTFKGKIVPSAIDCVETSNSIVEGEKSLEMENSFDLNVSLRR